MKDTTLEELTEILDIARHSFLIDAIVISKRLLNDKYDILVIGDSCAKKDFEKIKLYYLGKSAFLNKNTVWSNIEKINKEKQRLIKLFNKYNSNGSSLFEINYIEAEWLNVDHRNESYYEYILDEEILIQFVNSTYLYRSFNSGYLDFMKRNAKKYYDIGNILVDNDTKRVKKILKK